MKQLTIWKADDKGELRLVWSLELIPSMSLEKALHVCEIMNESLEDGLMCAVMVTEVSCVLKDE